MNLIAHYLKAILRNRSDKLLDISTLYSLLVRIFHFNTLKILLLLDNSTGFYWKYTVPNLNEFTSPLCIELNNYVHCFYILLNIWSFNYASIDFYTTDTCMYHINYMYVFTVIVNEYLGHRFHRLINFTFYGNKIVRQDLFCIAETAAISTNLCSRLLKILKILNILLLSLWQPVPIATI